MPRMRLLLFFALAAIPALSQTITARTFLFRAETTTVDPYSGMTNVCVLVYPDGKYRLERSFQSSQGGALEKKVYLDQLPPSSQKQIEEILDDQKFQQITTGPPRGGIIKDMDMLSVSVPREHAMQNLSFETVKERKPYETSLKPLMNWMRDVQKRKVPVAKQEQSNSCRAPQVMYRTMLRTQREPSEQNTEESGSTPDPQ